MEWNVLIIWQNNKLKIYTSKKIGFRIYSSVMNFKKHYRIIKN